MDKCKLFEQLTVLNLMLVDLQLYLDTHPQDMQALSRYNATLCQYDKVEAMYESMHGPLTSFRSYSKSPWQWIDDPWPWMNEANCKLAGEGGC